MCRLKHRYIDKLSNCLVIKRERIMEIAEMKQRIEWLKLKKRLRVKKDVTLHWEYINMKFKDLI